MLKRYAFIKIIIKLINLYTIVYSSKTFIEISSIYTYTYKVSAKTKLLLYYFDNTSLPVELI